MFTAAVGVFSRQMVAFVHDEMPIISDNIIDLSLANEALYKGDINLTIWFATAAADHAHRVTRLIRERSEFLHPLIHQLTAVNKDQCVPPAFGFTQTPRSHSFAQAGA